MKPQCESCKKDLPPESKEAFICSHECTYCEDCTTGNLYYVCPNCGGNLEKRPTRKD